MANTKKYTQKMTAMYLLLGNPLTNNNNRSFYHQKGQGHLIRMLIAILRAKFSMENNRLRAKKHSNTK